MCTYNFNNFLQHKTNLLTAGICEDDDEFNIKYDDEEDVFGLGYFFVISELCVPRKSNWGHQHLNWFAHVKKLEHEDIFAKTFCLSFQAFPALVDMLF